MTTFDLRELACFDTESTGTDVESDRIVSATVAHIVGGSAPEVVSHLIAVDVDIPAGATEVHGITTEQARANGKPAAEVLEATASFLTELMANNIPIIGMNLAYDFTLLDRELRRHGLPTLDGRLGRDLGPIVDIFVIDKALDRYRRGGRKLTDLAATYGVRHDGAHNATEDALCSARVAYKLFARAQRALDDPQAVYHLYADRKYPDQLVRAFQALGRMSLSELHAAQRGWYAEQSLSLAQYFRQKANEEEHRARYASEDGIREQVQQDAEDLRRRADDVSTDWPLRPYGGAR